MNILITTKSRGVALCIMLMCFLLPFGTLRAQIDSPGDTPDCTPADLTTVHTLIPGTTVVLDPPTNDPQSFPPEDSEGDRLIYFAHGYGGTEDSWLAAQAHLNAESLTSLLRIKATYNETYTSDVGIERGATSWANDKLKERPYCEDNGIDITQNMVIAHSFGGLATRYQYDSQAQDNSLDPEDRTFQGLITFDTPHGGAQFANNFEQIDEFVISACTELTPGPLASALLNTPFFAFFSNTAETVGQVTNRFCNSAVGPASNFLLQQYSGRLIGNPQSTLNELRVTPNNAVLNTLNSSATVSPPHQIAISSNETQEDLVWRLLWWAGSDNTNNYAYGDANTDGPLADDGLAAQWEAMYSMQAQTATVTPAQVPCRWGWFLGAAGFGLCKATLQQQANTAAANNTVVNRAQWRRGAEWFQQADLRYKLIGGFAELSTVTVPGSGCECNITGIYGQSGANWYSTTGNISNCEANCQALAQANAPSATYNFSQFTTDRTEIQPTFFPNDGIVLQESQEEWGNIVWRYSGSNHFQVRNDDTTEDALNRALYLGDEDEWFKSTDQ